MWILFAVGSSFWQESSEITGIPARVEPRLIEQNFGKYESTARNGEEFQKAKQQFITRYDGGESMLHLAQRIYNLLDEIKEESDHKTYILVAHNGISRVILVLFLRDDKRRIRDIWSEKLRSQKI